MKRAGRALRYTHLPAGLVRWPGSVKSRSCSSAACRGSSARGGGALGQCAAGLGGGEALRASAGLPRFLQEFLLCLLFVQ